MSLECRIQSDGLSVGMMQLNTALFHNVTNGTVCFFLKLAHSLVCILLAQFVFLSFLKQHEVFISGSRNHQDRWDARLLIIFWKKTDQCPEITPLPADLFTILDLFILFNSISTDVMCTSCAHITPCALGFGVQETFCCNL